MKILALTSIRSEYDLMSQFYRLLDEDPEIDFRLLVGGCHNSPSFGLTVHDIERDGFTILTQIESLIDGDSRSSRIKSAAVLLLSSIDVVKAFSPDLIIYAGDREEVMIGALLGGYLGIPTLHFFGGDHACDGHIDNPVRHAVSKLSTCHFVSTVEQEQRLIKIGEPKSRIFNVGSVALDKFKLVSENKNILNVVAGRDIQKPSVLFIFHPVTEEVEFSDRIVLDSLELLIETGFHVFTGLPNSDYGNLKIRNALQQFSKNGDVTLYGNLPRNSFIELFKSCQLIVGNSSAGILEAASIPIPCVNIGLRQKGRLCADNVVFVGVDRDDILNGIEIVTNSDFINQIESITNPYGDGNASGKAFSLLKKINFYSMLKKKEDPLYVC
ncbi:UDP-N-acetylglucosamine 2-epimerase [Photorhabdus tasmaniensis]|uniref:UDP-N-acetylglucosamine 2-epimerase n=1 Tax=Photorhabdus tasmaniensis TaxID=1004159 RepID=UPI004041CEE9